MAARSRLDVVTGSFGFTGQAITERLLASGRDVVTLSRRSGTGNPVRDRIRVEPFDPDAPGAVERLSGVLGGVDTLYNTYWLRFPRGGMRYERAVAQSAVLVEAARRAGVRRLVHVSVVNATVDGPTPYVRA